jgi:hypothetical protein
VVAHTFNPSTWEAEAGKFPGQPGLQSEFQDSQGYTEKPCLKKPKTKTNNRPPPKKKKKPTHVLRKLGVVLNTYNPHTQEVEVVSVSGV